MSSRLLYVYEYDSVNVSKVSQIRWENPSVKVGWRKAGCYLYQRKHHAELRQSCKEDQEVSEVLRIKCTDNAILQLKNNFG